MASSIAVQFASTLTVTETLDTASANPDLASGSSVVHSAFNGSANLTGATTPPATLVAAFEKALSGGAATIDLRALLGTNGIAVDGNGLKVQCVKFRNKTGNANSITIAKGASNGSTLFGSSWTITIPPGGEVTYYSNDGGPDVGATDKTIDLSGTGSQVLQVIVVLG